MAATFLEGDDVVLTPPTEDDVPFLLENWNDPEVRAHRSEGYPRGLEEVRRYVGGRFGGENRSIALVVRHDDRPVGLVLLVREKPNDEPSGRGELAHWVTPDEQGQGYATDACAALLDHAFSRLRLHKVVARAVDTDAAAQSVLEALGFVEEGVLRDEAFLDDGWHDRYRYGLLAEEWREGEP